MTLSKEEINLEKEYLKKTLSLLKKEIDDNEYHIDFKRKQVFEIKKYMWDYKVEMDLLEKKAMELSFNQDLIAGQRSIDRNFIISKMYFKPYFGRVDFNDKTHKEKIEVYVGLSSLADKKRHFYVNDWRSPISSLYYDYEIEPAQYNSPNGIVVGEVTLKRQYKIEDGKLKYAFNSSLNINDEILQDALGQNATDKMKDIVTTIQKEQNLIIRNDEKETLIVEGPAGSGKTSVALHHIAYLLYKNRKIISANNILIFSPNDIFSEYISEVLPNLGEDNVYNASFSDYMYKFLIEYENLESYMEFLERVFNIKDKTEKAIIKLKLSKEFATIIDEYVEILVNSVRFKNVAIDDKFLFEKSDIEKLYFIEYKNYNLETRLSKIEDYIYMKYRHQVLKKEKAKEVLREIKNQLPKIDKYKIILKNMYNNEKIKKLIEKIDPNINYDYLKNVSNKNLNGEKINYEDSILFLYLKGKISGFEKNSYIKYVIIDEAQDYNFLQYKILRSIFYKARFVVLGDANQRVNNLFGYDSIKEIGIQLDDKIKFLPLLTAYRNTFEITNFCNEILDLYGVNAIKRHGDEPLVYNCKNEDESYIKIVNEINYLNNYKTIAIIVENDEICENIREHLKKLKIDCGTYKDNAFLDKKVHILPIYYAKGLEFDAVLVYNKISLFNDKKLFYVACSRALHKLIIVNEYKQ